MHYINYYKQELDNELTEYCQKSFRGYPSSKETESLFQQLDEINDYLLDNKKSNNYQKSKTKISLSKDSVIA